MLILSAGEPGPSGVMQNIVVTQDSLPADLPDEVHARMSALLDRQVAQMAEHLAGFEEISRRIEGTMAELKVDWHNAQAKLTQSITFVQNGPDALVIATATAGRGDFADVEPVFRDMLKSFRIA